MSLVVWLVADYIASCATSRITRAEEILSLFHHPLCLITCDLWRACVTRVGLAYDACDSRRIIIFIYIIMYIVQSCYGNDVICRIIMTSDTVTMTSEDKIMMTSTVKIVTSDLDLVAG